MHSFCESWFKVIHPETLNNFIIGPGVLVALSVFQNMRIVAAVLKRTLAFALVKVHARNFPQSVSVLLNQVILFRSTVHHVIAWNYHKRSFTANWASSEVLLCSALVVGSTPASNASDTEGMVARLQNAKLFSFSQNWFQTNLALLIILLYVGLFLRRVSEISDVAALGVLELTLISIPTEAFYEVLANDLLFVTVDEMLDEGVLVVLHVNQHLFRNLAHNPESFYYTFFVKILIQDDSFSFFTISLLFVILKHVWVVV